MKYLSRDTIDFFVEIFACIWCVVAAVVFPPIAPWMATLCLAFLFMALSHVAREDE